MNFNKYEYTVPEYAIYYLAYQENNGSLDESELRNILRFINRLPDKGLTGHFSFPETEAYFSTCNDIDIYAGDALDIIYLIPKRKYVRKSAVK